MSDLKRLCENSTLDFVERGACRGVPAQLFYPEKDDNDGCGIPTLARQLCATCPVKLECLAWAVAHERHGFWGGHTDRERRKIRKTLGISLQSPKVDPPIDHGTERGYMQHIRRGVTTCERCKDAHARYHNPEQNPSYVNPTWDELLRRRRKPLKETG